MEPCCSKVLHSFTSDDGKKPSQVDFLITIQEEGFRAFQRGLDEWANPYQSGTEESEFWSDGWQDAEDDHTERAKLLK